MPQIVTSLNDIDCSLYVVCQSVEGALIRVDKHAALSMCRILNELMEEFPEEGNVDMYIPLDISTLTLMKVFTYCEYRVDHLDELPYLGKGFEDPIIQKPVSKKLSFLFENEFDKHFMIGPEGAIQNGDVSDHKLMLDILRASNFLHCEWIKDLCVSSIASFVMGRNVDTVRKEVFKLPAATESEKKHYQDQHNWIDTQYNIDAIVRRQEHEQGTKRKKPKKID